MPRLPPEMQFLLSRRSQTRMAAITAACAAAGVAYALLAPRWFESTLTVVPAKVQKASLASLGGDIASLAAGFEGSFGNSADGARIAAVLESTAVTDSVIDKFDLGARYEQKYRESTRETLWRHCAVKTLTKPNLVQLTCEDKDPKFVQQMVAHFAEVGNEAFRRVSVSSASEEVRFLEKRLVELRQAADAASARMREFQEKHQIFDLETQSKAVASALTALNNERITKQLQLEYAGTFSAPDEPSLRHLRSQIGVIDEKLRSLEQSPTPREGAATTVRPSGGVLPAAMSVPKLRADFEELFRDRTVAESTLVFALGRLEAARANEARDVSTFLVLDPPALPTRKSSPRGMMTVLLATILGLASAFVFEWWTNGGLAALFAERDRVGALQRARAAGAPHPVRAVREDASSAE